jgi:acyl-CoA synthetase (AMP-forming)/AMP-acid ligase II
MITSPPVIATRHRATRLPPRPRERCPFLEQVGDVQLLQRPRTPAHSLWPTELDARAGEVLAAFARTGGVASGDEVALLLRRRTSQPISMLGRWIVEQRVVSFAWRGDLVLPMFQFDRADMGVSAAVGAVLDELDGTFDDWDLATWFALPNAWLAGRAPVDALDHDPDAVRQAARADRFIARG